MKKLTPAALLLILIAAPLPMLYFAVHFVLGMQELNLLDEDVERVHLKTVLYEDNKRKEGALFASLKNPDPHYLDKNVETLTFLLPEVKKFEAILSETPGDDQIARRLQFLKEGGNRLVFSEEQIRTHEMFREVEERQQHPVEMNEEDFKKLLCLIEGVTIWPYGPKEGRPQLIVTDLKLSKKELPNQEKVYAVSMNLLKRESLKDPCRLGEVVDVGDAFNEMRLDFLLSIGEPFLIEPVRPAVDDLKILP